MGEVLYGGIEMVREVERTAYTAHTGGTPALLDGVSLGLKFLLAVLALMVPGEVLLRWLTPEIRWGWCRPLVAFGIGQGVATWCLWCLGMAGVPMWSWGIGMVMLAGVLALGYLVWRLKNRGGGVAGVNGWYVLGGDWKCRMRVVGRYLPLLILFVCAWVVAVRCAAEALEFRIGSVPGLGNWAFKTKLLLMTESWPSDYFEYDAHNRQMGYPPGFPLLCGWFAMFMGGLETHAIRLLPVCLVTGAFLLAGGEMVRRRGWWGLPGVAALMALFLCYPGTEVLSHFYAEPLLLFTAAVTVVALGRAWDQGGGMLVALLAAGCMAWTKNEGVVGFVLIAGCLWVFAGRSGASRSELVIGAMCVGGGMILLWRVYLAVQGWSDESFAMRQFVADGRWKRLAQAWEEYRKYVFAKGAWMGGAWWIAPILGWFALQRDGGILPVIVITAAGWVAVAIVMMMGSVVEDFSWHLAAASRVLLCPSMLMLMGYAYIGTKKGGEEDERVGESQLD